MSPSETKRGASSPTKDADAPNVLFSVKTLNGFSVYPPLEDALTDWNTKLKNKDGTYIKKMEDLLSKHIILSQPYYFYNKETKKMQYSVRYVFYKNDYTSLAKVLNKNNCLFEIVPKSHVKPYFDLEIEQDNITPAKCKKLLKLFMEIIIYEFQKQFDIELKEKDILIADSCKPNKLSYHIVICNGTYFENNSEQSLFIKYLAYVFNAIPKDLPAFYKKAISKLTWFKNTQKYIFDTIPYSCLQNFRCVNQSKFVISVDDNTITQYMTSKSDNDFKKINITCSSMSNCLKIVSKHQIVDSFIRVFDVDKMQKLDVTKMDTLISSKIDEITKRAQKTKTKLSKKDLAFCNMFGNDAHNPALISTKGETLFIKQNMTVKQMKTLPKYKQYLYLICQQVHYTIWLAIGFSIASSGGTKDDWIMFSKLNDTQYKEGECTSFDGFRKTGQVYGISYLQKLAKTCSPDIYEQLCPNILDEYFAIDLSGLYVIEESNDFVSHVYNKKTEKYVFDDKIMTTSKFLIIHAFMGKGKTVVIKLLMEKYGFKKILFLSPRISFSYFVKGEFNCDIYLETLDSDNLVCQLESLYKLTTKEFDCIIIDESESVLKQFSSETMKKPLTVWNSLETYIKGAKKVILADAFITRRTIEFCKDSDVETKGITYFLNNSPPVERRAIQIREQKLADCIYDDIENGKKVYACFSTKKAITDLEIGFNVLKRTEKFKDKKGIFYYATKDDKLDKTLENVNKVWTTKDLVAGSPKLTVGNSCSAPNYFDRAYVNAKSSCCVRDTSQSIMRVRHLKENILFFSLPIKKVTNYYSLNYMLKRYDVRNEFKKNMIGDMLDDKLKCEKNEQLVEKLQSYKKVNDENDIPKGLHKILFFNMYEDYLSKVAYSDMFLAFLRLCNYKIELLPTTDKATKGEKKIVPETEYESNYKSIETIDRKKFIDIKTKIKNKCASEKEKLSYEKYEFIQYFDNGMETGKMADIFYKVFLRSSQKHIIYNLFYAKNSTITKMLITDLEQKESIIGLQKFTSQQKVIIDDLVKLLGLEHCHDVETVIEKDIVVDKISPYFDKHYEAVCSAFCLTAKPLKLVKNKNCLYFGILRNVFLKWCGCGISTHELDKHTKNAINYIFKGLSFYEHIKKLG